MTSIHCTDCPCYDEKEPAICCSTVISPKSQTIVISEQDKHHHDRADQHIISTNSGLFGALVISRSYDPYFHHKNEGNC